MSDDTRKALERLRKELMQSKREWAQTGREVTDPVSAGYARGRVDACGMYADVIKHMLRRLGDAERR